MYDVLGDSEINTNLQELLVAAICDEGDPSHQDYLNEVIDEKIGQRIEDLVGKRALVLPGIGQVSDRIKEQMELAKARKLQPGFIQSFFVEVLKKFGGRITAREPERFEITRVPAIFRNVEQLAKLGGMVHEKYERVTFHKDAIEGEGLVRADLIGPGHSLLSSLIDVINTKYSSTLSEGTILIDPLDMGQEPRLLVYLEHAIADGRLEKGQQSVVSRKFQFVELDQSGEVKVQERGRISTTRLPQKRSN